MSSGEQDSLSRGFSISLQEQQLHTSIVNGLKYWRVSIAAAEFPVSKYMPPPISCLYQSAASTNQLPLPISCLYQSAVTTHQLRASINCLLQSTSIAPSVLCNWLDCYFKCQLVLLQNNCDDNESTLFLYYHT